MRSLIAAAAARLSYANVIATAALFIALGGSAWALAKNSVGSRQIENGTVRSQEIANATIRGEDLGTAVIKGTNVAVRTLTGANLAASAVTGAEVGDGTLSGADIDESSLGAVPEAETVDGLDSGAFARGAGETYFASGSLAIGAPDEIVLEAPIGSFELECDDAGNRAMVYRNGSGATVDGIRESRGDVLNSTQLFSTLDGFIQGFLLPVIEGDIQRHEASLVGTETAALIDLQFGRPAGGCRYSLVVTEFDR